MPATLSPPAVLHLPTTRLDPDGLAGHRIRPVTVPMYMRMVKTGILDEGEAVELINGVVVRKDRSAQGDDPMTVDPRHAYGVQRLERLDTLFRQHGCHLRGQKPIDLRPYNMPEPDAVIVVGDETRYLTRHPRAADILAVIEVS